MNQLRKEIRGNFRSSEIKGYLAPYSMTIVGIIWLFTMPLNINNMVISKGAVTKCDYSSILIEGYEESFSIEFKKNKDLIKEKISTSNRVKIWTKEDSNIIKQIAIDGQIIVSYKWWNYSKFPIIFISIGLLLMFVSKGTFPR